MARKKRGKGIPKETTLEKSVQRFEAGDSGPYTLAEACKISGFNSRQLMYKIRTGELTAEKLGWFWTLTRPQVEALKELFEAMNQSSE